MSEQDMRIAAAEEIIRTLRAGWDKQADYLITAYAERYGVQLERPRRPAG